jgi:hypothetical protein
MRAPPVILFLWVAGCAPIGKTPSDCRTTSCAAGSYDVCASPDGSTCVVRVDGAELACAGCDCSGVLTNVAHWCVGSITSLVPPEDACGGTRACANERECDSGQICVRHPAAGGWCRQAFCGTQGMPCDVSSACASGFVCGPGECTAGKDAYPELTVEIGSLATGTGAKTLISPVRIYAQPDGDLDDIRKAWKWTVGWLDATHATAVAWCPDGGWRGEGQKVMAWNASALPGQLPQPYKRGGDISCQGNQVVLKVSVDGRDVSAVLSYWRTDKTFHPVEINPVRLAALIR